ncbi:MAG: TIGR01212 family radical SAM protein [Pseudodesulfovibrio sp.]|nr:TIGR01212 family radical SAM protein [Pseudodesulfovibrio sp.]
MHRTYALSSYTRQSFGQRVQKIPLDAGFSCPNRDGTLSRQGCIFCNPNGSGSGLRERGLTIAEQWQFWHDIHNKNHKLELFTAYLQSYSNTHGPIEKLARVISSLKGLPGLTSLSLGTRPDCLDEEKLDLLSAQQQELGLREVVLELGLQSACNETLTHINRGHDAQAFAKATRAAAERGLKVVAHIIAGLPTPHGREGQAELLASVDFVNQLPVHGIKFHNLYVCRGTGLAQLYENNTYTPLTQPEFLSHLSEAIMHLNTTTVIHRLNGNPLKDELIAPDWAANMRAMHNSIRSHFKANDIWQGKKNGAESGPPDWFSPHYTGNIP